MVLNDLGGAPIFVRGPKTAAKLQKAKESGPRTRTYSTRNNLRIGDSTRS